MRFLFNSHSLSPILVPASGYSHKHKQSEYVCVQLQAQNIFQFELNDKEKTNSNFSNLYKHDMYTYVCV
jgi:hypothetical protein